MPYRFRDDLRRHWLLVVLLAVVVALWGWFDVRRRGRIESGREDAHKTDFTVYTVAGAAFFDGRDPYQVTNVRGWSYLYPPLFALAVSPLAGLDTETQTFVWFLISVGFAVGCYVESRRILDHCLQELRPAHAGGLTTGAIMLPALLAVALPALNCLQRGQIGLLQLYLMLVGVRWILFHDKAWRWLAGGIILAAPVVLKITPALPVAVVLGMLALRAFRSSVEWGRFAAASSGVAAGVALWLLVVPATILGWQSNLAHLQAFSDKVLQQASHVRNDDFGGEIDSPRNQSLDNALYRMALWVTYVPDIGPDGRPLVHVSHQRIGELPRVPVANQIALVINALLLLLLAAQVLALGRDGRATSLMLGFSLAAALSLIVSPVARGHYFVQLLPVLVAAPLWLQSLGKPRAALLVTWVPVVLTIIHYATINSLGRLGLYGLAIALWYVALAISAWPRSSGTTANSSVEPLREFSLPRARAA